MANVLFDVFKGVQLGDAAFSGFTAVNFESDTINALLLDSADDTIAPQTDQDLADIVGGAIVATGTLASKTVVTSTGTSTFDAADTTLSAVTGDQSETVVIYKHTGTSGTSQLIVYFDTFASGMPVTPNGGDIVLQWNASGIFAW